MAPRRFKYNFNVIFKLILMIDGWGIFREIAIRWMSMDLTDDKSTMAEVMAWCCQTKKHYLSQRWPVSISPYGVTMPQWVNMKIILWVNLRASEMSVFEFSNHVIYFIFRLITFCANHNLRLKLVLGDKFWKRFTHESRGFIISIVSHNGLKSQYRDNQYGQTLTLLRFKFWWACPTITKYEIMTLNFKNPCYLCLKHGNTLLKFTNNGL